MAERPNILMLSMDTLRYDAVACNGNALVKTPNLDRLAGDGVRFTRAYCSQPICMPCRSSIMTGRFPSAHGVWENGVPLRSDEVLLPAVLAEAGYDTHCYGKYHFQPWQPSLSPADGSPPRAEYDGEGPYCGFQHVRLVDHSYADAYSAWVRERHGDCAELALHPFEERPADKPVAWKTALAAEATKTHYISQCTIDAVGKQSDEQPFLIWASFIDPHHPLAPPQPFCDWYDDVDFPAPPGLDEPPESLPAHYAWWRHHIPGGEAQPGDTVRAQWQQMRRMYQGKISHVDHEIGRILEALEVAGLAANTIVLFLSDHGTMLGDYGLMKVGPYSMEAMCRIPMIWRVPGAANERTCDGLVSAVDVMPTLLDLVGVELPLGVQGRSLRAVLQGSSDTVRQRLMVEQRTGQNPPEGFKTLVTPQHKLSLYANGREGELYDLEADPDELNNLFNRPEVAEIQRDLTAAFARELLLLDDPLPRRVSGW